MTMQFALRFPHSIEQAYEKYSKASILLPTPALVFFLPFHLHDE